MTITDTDLAEQVAQLRADLERHRLDPAVKWVARTGRVRHLTHESYNDRSKGLPWTFCDTMLDRFVPATPDDDRPICQRCEHGRRDLRNWQEVDRDREREATAERRREREERDARRDDDMTSIDESLTYIHAMGDLRKERDRRERLQTGEQERPKPTLEQLRARTAQIRAENDRVEAEQIAAAT